MELRTYQKTGAEFLAARLKAYLGDSMGLGKTPTATRAAISAGCKRILWIAPAATLPGLAAEIQKWGAPKPVILDQCGRIAVPAGPVWCLIAWTSLATRKDCLTKGERWDLAVFDEAHKTKNPMAKQTRAALGRIIRKANGKVVRTRCVATAADRNWFLSGTPIMNRPIDLQQMLYLGLNQPWASRQEYGEAFCLRKNPRSPVGYDFDGARDLQTLALRLAETGAFLRRTPEDVPGELPALSVQVVPLACPDAKCALDTVAIRRALGRGVPPPFEECSAYRRAVGLKKVPAAAAWIKNFLETEEAVVVFGWHPEVVGRLCEVVGLGGSVLHGGTPTAARQAAVDEFARQDGPRVLYGTIGACGTGLNGMHLRTSACVFAESSWVPADMEQAIGRVRRIGGTGQEAKAYILCADDSLEAYVMQVVTQKIATAGTVLAGVTGDMSFLE